jgi:catechol 2,3-dioxygenase-like lactoylglutathione lyase family enzyme
MKIRGVDFIMYRVGDLSRAVEFYRDLLGLKLETHSPEYQWAKFDCGNVTLGLHGGEGPPSATGPGARVAWVACSIAMLAIAALSSASAAGPYVPSVRW